MCSDGSDHANRRATRKQQFLEWEGATAWALYPNVKPCSSMAAVVVLKKREMLEKHVHNGEVVLKKLEQQRIHDIGTGQFIASDRVLTSGHVLVRAIFNNRTPDRVMVEYPLMCVCVPLVQYLRHSLDLKMDAMRLLYSGNGGIKATGARCLCPSLESRLRAWVGDRDLPQGADQVVLHLPEAAQDVQPVTVMPSRTWRADESQETEAVCFGITKEPFENEDIFLVESELENITDEMQARPWRLGSLPANQLTRVIKKGFSFKGMSGGPLLRLGPGSDPANKGKFRICLNILTSVCTCVQVCMIIDGVCVTKNSSLNQA